MTEASALLPDGEEGPMDWVACIGVDWADQEHSYELRTADGCRSSGVVGSAPERLHAWMRSVRVQFPEGNILFVVEDGRPSLLDAVMEYPFLTIIRINPLASKKYRESRRLSGSSSDPVDAALLCDYALRHLDELRVWRPSDAITRKLRALTAARRRLVDQRTGMIHQLTAVLKGYYPQLLEWLKDVRPNVLWQIVRIWPTLKALQAADLADLAAIMKAHRLRHIDRRVRELAAKLTAAVALTDDATVVEVGALSARSLASVLETLDAQIDQYDAAIEEAWSSHPDRQIFDSLPGAGPVLGPRLAAALTTDRDHYQNAAELQCYSGIAPVTEASGKRRSVHARWQFPKFIHQTFHEYAESSLPHSAWARESYRQQKERGAGHHAAIRTVAFQWMRVIFRIWKGHLRYDEAAYLAALSRRGSPLAARLAA